MLKTPEHDEDAAWPALGRLLAHRLADRLSVILANLEFACAAAPGEGELREALAEAHESAEAIAAVIDELRWAARVHSAPPPASGSFAKAPLVRAIPRPPASGRGRRRQSRRR